MYVAFGENVAPIYPKIVANELENVYLIKSY